MESFPQRGGEAPTASKLSSEEKKEKKKELSGRRRRCLSLAAGVMEPLDEALYSCLPSRDDAAPNCVSMTATCQRKAYLRSAQRRTGVFTPEGAERCGGGCQVAEVALSSLRYAQHEAPLAVGEKEKSPSVQKFT